LTEEFTAIYAISYKINEIDLAFDYTLNFYLHNQVIGGFFGLRYNLFHIKNRITYYCFSSKQFRLVLPN
jgi:hypothetical protein